MSPTSVAEPDHGRLMTDRVDAAERPGDGRAVGEVGFDQLRGRVQVVGWLSMRPGQQAVQHAHGVAIGDERVDDV